MKLGCRHNYHINRQAASRIIMTFLSAWQYHVYLWSSMCLWKTMNCLQFYKLWIKFYVERIRYFLGCLSPSTGHLLPQVGDAGVITLGHSPLLRVCTWSELQTERRSQTARMCLWRLARRGEGCKIHPDGEMIRTLDKLQWITINIMRQSRDCVTYVFVKNILVLS